VNNYISHRLPGIAQYWSNYRFWQLLQIIGQICTNL